MPAPAPELGQAGHSSQRWTRRQALGAGATLVAGMLARPTRGSGRSSDSRLRVAAVGVGGQGWHDLNAVATAPGAAIAALCDVDQQNLDRARSAFGAANTFRDYREMLAGHGEDFDAVIVSTPDHMHGAIALAAMAAGKHVYLQKPLAHNLTELRRLVEVAADKGVVTQMGTQIHGHEAYRTAVMLLRQGVIGKVHAAHSWVNSSWAKPFQSSDRAADPIPPTLDWDLWQGVAPERPFVLDQYLPAKWRRWRAYGGGTLGDMGCHLFDPLFSALDLKPPIEVESSGPCHPGETFAVDADVRYTFAGTPRTADQFTLRWTHGAIAVDAAAAGLPEGAALPESGSFVVGEGGVMVLPHWAMPSFYRGGASMDINIKSAGSVNHYHEWVGACCGKGIASTPFSYSAKVTETVLLGTLAGDFPQQRLAWNSAALAFVDPKAGGLISRTYRNGWRPDGL